MNTPEKVKKQPKEPNKLLLVVVGVIMLAAWCINLRWGIWAMDNDRTRGGEWGDIFGAVNALFSGITLIFLIYGIWVQRYEVDLAKAELAESKEQTRDQKKALDKQNWANEKQNFENTFFKLLDALNNARNSLVWHEDKNISGAKYFSKFISIIRDSWSQIFFYQEGKATIEDIERCVTPNILSYKQAFVPYINITIEIIRHLNDFGVEILENSICRDPDADIYTRKFSNIFLGNYTHDELMFIGMFCLSSVSGDHAKSVFQMIDFFEPLRNHKTSIEVLLIQNGFLGDIAPKRFSSYWN